MSSLFLEPRHVYDHGTIWTNTVITYFSFSFKYRLLLPLVCSKSMLHKEQPPYPLFCCGAILPLSALLYSVRYTYMLWGLIPQCFVDIPCTLSGHSVSYHGQTRFLIKPFAASNVAAPI